MQDYELCGESTRLSEKYLRKQAGQALIQFRYALHQMIDKGFDKLEDLNPNYWTALEEIRESKEAQDKSAKMATIARGQGSKNTTKKSVEQSVLVRLVSKCASLGSCFWRILDVEV